MLLSSHLSVCILLEMWHIKTEKRCYSVSEGSHYWHASTSKETGETTKTGLRSVQGIIKNWKDNGEMWPQSPDLNSIENLLKMNATLDRNKCCELQRNDATGKGCCNQSERRSNELLGGQSNNESWCIDSVVGGSSGWATTAEALSLWHWPEFKSDLGLFRHLVTHPDILPSLYFSRSLSCVLSVCTDSLLVWANLIPLSLTKYLDRDLLQASSALTFSSTWSF